MTSAGAIEISSLSGKRKKENIYSIFLFSAIGIYVLYLLHSIYNQYRYSV